jgi:hypothetical protein
MDPQENSYHSLVLEFNRLNLNLMILLGENPNLGFRIV